MDDSLGKYAQQIFIEGGRYIYRVQHRTMEGDCQYDHGPRLVKLNSYHIDQYPVTNGLYKVFLDETGYRPADGTNFLKHWIGGGYPPEIENHPVVWVSQGDAKAYARWRGCRLPYDTEWQYAAAGASKRKWPWGDRFDKNLCNSDGSGTVPVDQYPEGAGASGCCDMCGNTWEWVEDSIDDGQHEFTFLRGGCYHKARHFWHAEGGPHPNDYHLKFLTLCEGLNRCATVGFRCARGG